MPLKSRLTISLAGCIAGIVAVSLMPFYAVFLSLLLTLPVARYHRPLIFFTIFAVLASSLAYRQSIIPNHHIAKLDPHEVTALEGKIIKISGESFNNRILLELENLYYGTPSMKQVRGKAIIRTPKTVSFPGGTRISVSDPGLKPVSKPLNPGMPDFREYWTRQGVFWEGRSSGIEVIQTAGTASRIITGLRQRYQKKIERNLPYSPDEQALLQAITMGGDDIPFFIREAGRRSGTYHLMVISGLHLGFIYLLLKLLFIPLRNLNNTHPKVFPVIVLSALWLYAYFTGLRTPVVRAALMFSFLAGAELFERRADAIQCVALAAILLLLLDPAILFSLSFQLTFIVTSGLLILTSRYKSIMRRGYIQGLCFCAIAAQISAAPLIMLYFQEFYIISFISNILFVPFAGIIVMSSFASMLLPPLYGLLRYMLTWFLNGLTAAADLSRGISLGLAWQHAVIIYSTIVFVAAERRRRSSVIMFASLSLVLLLSPMAVRAGRPDDKERIYILSADKPSIVYMHRGESALLLPDHFKNNEIEESVIPLLAGNGIKKIDSLFFTHTSYNRIGALKRLKPYKSPANIWPPGVYIEDMANPLEQQELFPVLAAGEMLVDLVGIENGYKNYILSSGAWRILVAGYIGERTAARLEHEHFDAVYLNDFRNIRSVRDALVSMDFNYLALPGNYRRFDFINPGERVFYLNEGAVKLLLTPEGIKLAGHHDKML